MIENTEDQWLKYIYLSYTWKMCRGRQSRAAMAFCTARNLAPFTGYFTNIIYTWFLPHSPTVVEC